MAADPSQSLRPRAIRRQGDGLLIEWSDGLRSFVTWKYLRDHCPCASCLEQRKQPDDPFRVLSPAEVAAGPVQPVAMHARGYYAYQIVWNDGHDTGIYSLRLLRDLSEPIRE